MNISKGRLGENIACELLISKKYKIIERNYRTRFGEIDIIAMDEEILVFVEVKARSTIDYGYPYESVDRNKQDKIIETSYDFLQNNSYTDYQIRYDIIEVYLTSKKYNHIENAFVL